MDLSLILMVMEKQMLFTQATKKMSTFVTTNPSILKRIQ